MKHWFFIGVLLFSALNLSAQDYLTLSECMETALNSNRGIQKDKYDMMSTLSMRKSAFSQYFPSVSLTANYTRLNKQFSLFSEDVMMPIVPYTALDPATGQVDMDLLSSPTVAPFCIVIDPATQQPVLDANGNPLFRNYAWLPADEAKMGQKNNYLFNLGLVQPVFMGGKIRQLNKMANYTVRLSEQKTVVDENELLYKVQDTYWKMVSLNEKVKLATKYKELIERFIDDLNSYEAEGIITSNDLLKAGIKLNEAEMNILKANNGLLLVQMSLNQMMGQDLNKKWLPTDSIVPDLIPQIADAGELIQKARNQRAEMTMLDLKVKMNESELKIARSRFMPDIGFSANYFYVNPSPYKGFDNVFDHDWNLGFTMSMPLFHWGDRWHTLKAAQAQLEGAKLEYEDAAQMIMLEVQMTMNQYNEALARIELNKSIVGQSEENLRIINNRFAEGMAKPADVLEAQTLWLEAATNLIEARAEAYSLQNKLNKVTGNIR